MTYDLQEAVNSEIINMDLQDMYKSFKTMNKKELEANFDLQVVRLEIFKEDNKLTELICDILDAIAHELYTRINHHLH